ncbi:MAG: hypothetical protein CME88_16950 [Hirschia sp.]|nr:hypothetical protein [Hirschia sp.]MBF20065.1 hypothetical protein [Hirschia sp.]|tara:strand:+ start:860 stop:1438 length:579 start_codon:yes stop_codon:yes gene_type:complete
MKKERDYKAEYARRMERGKARGLSLSQARGHPRRGEPLASSPQAKPKSDEKIEAAIRLMNEGGSLTASARESQVSSKRLKRFVLAHKLGRLNKRKWVMSDRRARRVPIIKGASQSAIIVPDFKTARLVGQHYNAYQKFVEEADESLLPPFEGRGVRDVKGRLHPFETDPNNLFRFAVKDEPVFHEIYQIIQS